MSGNDLTEAWYAAAPPPPPGTTSRPASRGDSHPRPQPWPEVGTYTSSFSASPSSRTRAVSNDVHARGGHLPVDSFSPPPDRPVSRGPADQRSRTGSVPQPAPVAAIRERRLSGVPPAASAASSNNGAAYATTTPPTTARGYSRGRYDSSPAMTSVAPHGYYYAQQQPPSPAAAAAAAAAYTTSSPSSSSASYPAHPPRSPHAYPQPQPQPLLSDGFGGLMQHSQSFYTGVPSSTLAQGSPAAGPQTVAWGAPPPAPGHATAAATPAHYHHAYPVAAPHVGQPQSRVMPPPVVEFEYAQAPSGYSSSSAHAPPAMPYAYQNHPMSAPGQQQPFPTAHATPSPAPATYQPLPCTTPASASRGSRPLPSPGGAGGGGGGAGAAGPRSDSLGSLRSVTGSDVAAPSSASSPLHSVVGSVRRSLPQPPGAGAPHPSSPLPMVAPPLPTSTATATATLSRTDTVRLAAEALMAKGPPRRGPMPRFSTASVSRGSPSPSTSGGALTTSRTDSVSSVSILPPDGPQTSNQASAQTWTQQAQTPAPAPAPADVDSITGRMAGTSISSNPSVRRPSMEAPVEPPPRPSSRGPRDDVVTGRGRRDSTRSPASPAVVAQTQPQPQPQPPVRQETMALPSSIPIIHSPPPDTAPPIPIISFGDDGPSSPTSQMRGPTISITRDDEETDQRRQPRRQVAQLPNAPAPPSDIVVSVDPPGRAEQPQHTPQYHYQPYPSQQQYAAAPAPPPVIVHESDAAPPPAPPTISIGGGDEEESEEVTQGEGTWDNGGRAAISISHSGPLASPQRASPSTTTQSASSPSSTGVGSGGGGRPDLVSANPSAAAPTNVGSGHMCGGCSKFVVGGKVVSAMGQRFHPQCFLCSHCSEPLEHVAFYEHEGKAYCHFDYHELFSKRCFHCRTPIVDERYITISDPELVGSGGNGGGGGGGGGEGEAGENGSVKERCYHDLHFFCANCGDPFLDPKAAGSVAGANPEALLGVDEQGRVRNGAREFVVWKGYPYCEKCHVNLHKPRCKGCKKPIADGDVITALKAKWHPHCFVCESCQRPFQDPSFFIREGRAYDEECYKIMLRNEL